MPMVMTTTWMMEGLGTHITGWFNTFSSSAPQYYQFKGTKKRSRNIFQAASVAAALNATCQSTERASCTLYGVFRLDGSSERPAAYWQSPCTKRNMHQVVVLCSFSQSNFNTNSFSSPSTHNTCTDFQHVHYGVSQGPVVSQYSSPMSVCVGVCTCLRCICVIGVSPNACLQPTIPTTH